VLLISSPFAFSGTGSFSKPKISDVSYFGGNEETIKRVVFSYPNGSEFVVGTKTSVHFVVDKPASKVWPIFQNFNAWQSQTGYFFTGELGDREGELEFIVGADRQDATIDTTQAMKVDYVIPEQALVLHTIPWEAKDKNGNLTGFRHEGKNVFMLSESKGKTVITAAMEHLYHHHGENAKKKAKAFLAQKVKVAKGKKENNSKDIWEKSFIPVLKKLLQEQR
jgi:hypothetical protein